VQRNSSSSVNDFAIKLANVNGTGSASANGLLMQAIFRMGIPVSGKNLFPSNIQGLPTWYEIRVNNEGHTARALNYDLMVAMNAQTYARDIKKCAKAATCFMIRRGRWIRAFIATTSTSCPFRSRRCATSSSKDARDRTLMKNIAYAGALVATLEIDMSTVEALLDERFAEKEERARFEPARAENRLRLRQRKIRLSAAVSLAADERE
jgi:2-oxoglutarate/2-oxoacid ferredoxin oxidoreductase subunit alpha